MDTNLEKQMMSIGEAAKYLGVSIDTLRRWEVRGRVRPSRSPGGHRYYTKDDLDQLFNKKYTRDEYSKKITNTHLESQQEETQNVTLQTTPDSSGVPSYSSDATIPPHNEALTPPPPPEQPQKQTPQVVANVSAETITPLQNISNSILEPTPTIQNQPAMNTTQAPVNLINQQREELSNILRSEKEDKLTTGDLLSIIGIVLFVALDVILFLAWYKSTNIIVPIP